MSAPPTAPAVLDRVYLEVRCKLLDIAACLDRVSRSDGAETVESDPRLAQIAQGIDILAFGRRGRSKAPA